MKTAVIRSSWMEGYGYRLDCSPYLGGALETKVLLEKLPLRKDKLKEVTTGIHHAGRESRQWVESPEYGVPFISGSDLQKADLSHLPLISKRQVVERPHFTLRSGYTLITRSGTLGKMAHARRNMDGLACSEHVLRVVPDTAKIPSGYLYAYLSSKFGISLVASGTYGAIIQHLESDHIGDLPVPRLGDALEHEVHSLVEEAADLRTQASAKLQGAILELETKAGVDNLTVLVPCSGQINGIIGRVFQPLGLVGMGVVGSDAIRVKCATKTEAGFVFLALRAEGGRRQLKARAFGGVRARLDVQNVGRVIIPDASKKEVERLGMLACQAAEAHSAAIRREREARALLERKLESS